MKKKLMYMVMTLVFALALGCGSFAILSTDSAVQRANAAAEGEDSTVTQSAENVLAWTKSGNNYYKVWNYTGSTQRVDLPVGQYKLEVWGAQGGNDSRVGGRGGYAQATISFTTATSVYIGVGGRGASSANSTGGGWNGGGHPGSYGSSGGGGGATHMATANGTLSSLKSNKNAVLVVGGGGGGAGNNADYLGWGGGSAPGTNVSGQGAIVNNDAYFGQGQNSQMRSPTNDGGGGGGGYWGGYGATSDTTAAGGMGYWNNGRMTGGSLINGNTNMPNPGSYGNNMNVGREGHGVARITFMNAPPQSKDATIASAYRGAKSVAIAPSTVAKDEDMYKTLTWVDTNKIYSDSTCATVVPSSKLTVSGMTANGGGSFTITPNQYFDATDFYVKVKDNLPATGIAKFRFGVTDKATEKKSGVNVYSATQADYEYRVGSSTTTDISKAQEDGQIHNPAGNGIYTVVIPKPISISATNVRVYAKDLFNDGDYSAYDDIVIKTVANPQSLNYEITTADFKYGAGYSYITIKAKAASASNNNYITTKLTVNTVDKTTNKILATNEIQLVFKVDNTRPKLLGDTSLAENVRGGELYIDTKVGESVTVNLDKLCYDTDRNSLEIKAVKVPSNEFIYLDKYGANLYNMLPASSNYYFTPDKNGVTDQSLSLTAEGTKALRFEKNSIVASNDVTAMSGAYLSYTINEGKSITLTPLRATRYQYDEQGRKGDFYFMIRVEDKGEPGDSGIWFPVAVKIANTQPTQPDAVAYADASDAVDLNGSKVMYFSPMGLGALDISGVGDDSKQVKGIAVDKDNFTVKVDNASLTGADCTNMYNEFLVFDSAQFGANGIENEFYKIEPITLYASYVTAAKIGGGKISTPANVDDFSWARYSEWGSDITLNAADNNIIEFKGIKVTFKRSTQGAYIQQPIVVKDTRGAANSATSAANTGTLEGLVNLLVKMDNNSVTALDDGKINKNVSGLRSYTDADTSAVKVKSFDGISVKVSNGNVEYSVPNGVTFEITPYDIANDLDLADGWNRGVNTNPNRTAVVSGSDITYTDNAGYTSQLAENNKALSYFYTTDLMNLSTAAKDIHLDELVFDGTPQVYNQNAGTVKLNTESGNNRLEVKTTGRTVSGNPMSFTVKVSDGKTSSTDIKVYVNVTNNTPEIRTNAQNVFYLSSNYLGLNDVTTNSSGDYSSDNYNKGDALYNTGYNIRELKPIDLAVDYEDQLLYFADGMITFYTLIGGEYVPFAGEAYVDASFAQASANRSGQVLKIIARQSTQNIEGGLYIGVKITDNYGMDSSANTSEIIIQVEVRNSLPVVNQNVENGFTKTENADGVSDYEWKISPNDESEVTSPKYLASSQAVYDALIADGVTAKNIRILASDNDKGQGLKLYAGEKETITTDYPNIPLYAIDNTQNRDANDVAVFFTAPNDSYSNPITLVNIVYYKSDGGALTKLDSPYKHSSTSPIASVDMKGVEGTKDYTDNVNWAIEIKSSTSFAKPMKFTVKVRDTADTSREGEVGYDGKRESNFTVNGAAALSFKVDIGTLGMTVTHNVYNRVGADGAINRKYYTSAQSNPTDKTDGTFEYNGIEVSASGAVNVPMSYFAFPASLPENANAQHIQSVNYNGLFAKSGTAEASVYDYISLTDGVTVWTGATLNKNPFVSFTPLAYDTISNGNFTSAYYNSEIVKYTGGTVISGRLFENKIGLTIKARGPRSASPLKLTLDLALYTDATAANPVISQSNNIDITAKVTVDLSITNESLNINEGKAFDTGSAIPKGNVGAYSFKLLNGAITNPDDSLLYIPYTDNNYIRDTNGYTNEDEALLKQYQAKYRDSARFLMNSIGLADGAGNVSTYLTPEQVKHMVSASGVINTGSTTIDGLLEYFGLTVSGTQQDKAATILALTEDELKANQPNKGYNKYFTVDSGNDGDTFTVRPVKKTTFDYTKAVGYDSTKTYAQNLAVVQTYAKDKGLAVELNEDKNGYIIYYPLKVIAYDTYSGSGFTDSTWTLLTVKLRINNTTPTVNNALYAGKNYYEMSLSLQDKYSMSIVNVINDRDMSVKTEGGATYFRSESEIASDHLDVDTTDYLVYSENYVNAVSGDVGYSSYSTKSESGKWVKDKFLAAENNVVDVKIDGKTIVFSATKKISGKTMVVIRFKDNRGAEVEFNVLVTITNQAPELLKQRTGNSLDGDKTNTLYYPENTAKITMKTGDSFDLTVTPYDMFLNDLTANNGKLGSFTGRNLNSFGDKTKFANLNSSGIQFINDSTGLSNNAYMGVYAVAEDDSASTLRFATFNATPLNGKISVNKQNEYKFSDSTVAPLSYHITARGVCNEMPLKFTVKDDEGKTLTITLIITVVSTPPSVITDPDANLPFGREENAGSADVTQDDIDAGIVFKVNMSVGDTPVLVNPTAICKDPDVGDTDNMYLYKAFSGSCFSIGGIGGLTSSNYVDLTVREGADGRVRSFTITAKNFISDASKNFEQIIFYVMDPSGQTLNDAQKIIINVYIAPNTVSNPGYNSSSVDKSERIDFSVKSREAFENEPILENKPSKLSVVSNGAARATVSGIIDKDYGASNTAYYISVFAMLDVETDPLTGELTNVKPLQISAFESKNSLSAGSDFTPYELKRLVANGSDVVIEKAELANSALYDYVAQYFEFTFSSDGSVIEFTPKNVTLEGEIPLYVKVVKRGIEGSTDGYSAVSIYSINVDNSAPYAIADNKINQGHFKPGEAFLTYSDYVGNKQGRTYTLFNTDEENHGLFGDMDSNDSVTYDSKAVNGSAGYEVLERYDYGDGKGFVATNTGWQANSIRGFGEAFTIKPVLDGTALQIVFNRKIDAGEEKGADSVKIPVKVYGKDLSGQSVSNIIILEIKNSDPIINEIDEQAAKDRNLPYTVVKDGDDYLLEMSVEKGESKTVKLEDFYSDLDRIGNKAYDLVNFTGKGSEYLTDISKKPSATHSVKDSNGVELFKVTTNSANEYLKIECTSYDRANSGLAKLIISDSAGAETAIINIKLTVANSKPMAADQKDRTISLLGSDTPNDANNTLKSTTYNILSFVKDYNEKDMTPYDGQNASASDRSFIRISGIAPNGEADIVMHPAVPDGDDTVYSSVIAWGTLDENPQEFFIKPQLGVYGTQSIIVTVIDDGNNNPLCGDALLSNIEIVFSVACDSDGMEPNVISIRRGVTKEVTVNDLFDKDGKAYSTGYTLEGFTVGSNSSNIVQAGDKVDDNGKTNYTLRAVSKADNIDAVVTANLKVGGVDKKKDFLVHIDKNEAPKVMDVYAKSEAYSFRETDEDEGLVILNPYQLFTDDAERDDVLILLEAKSEANSIVEANVDVANNKLMLKFKANRPAKVSVWVTDETGERTEGVIFVRNMDKPDLGFFASTILFIKANPFIFLVVGCALLLLIIILLIIILHARKKKKMRKEIEALLVSEMELEEQMLKLSAGPNQTYYQSYGYLPPTQQIQNNPSFMLGQGTDINTNSAIGLNPGEIPPTVNPNTTMPNTNDNPNNGFDDENF